MSKDKIKTVSIEEMLDAGVHFGHQTRRKDPLMSKFVFDTVRKNQIIDLYQTKSHLERAAEFLYEIAKTGKQIIIVGTKRQAAPIVKQYARSSGSLFVNQRWLGGTFTNFDSVEHNLKELERIETGLANNSFSHYTKKERLLLSRKVEKLEDTVGGLRGLKKFPGAMILVDIKREKTALAESRALKIPVVGMVDTNSNPDLVNFVIPSNDDAIKSIELVLSVLTDAIKKGYAEFAKEQSAQATPVVAPVTPAAPVAAPVTAAPIVPAATVTKVAPVVKKPEVKKAEVKTPVKAKPEAKVAVKAKAPKVEKAAPKKTTKKVSK